MEDKLILLDTSILIDLFRRKVKENSYFYQLSGKYQNFAVSTARFEIFVGQTDNQNEFWDNFYDKVKIIVFDDECAQAASRIVKQLKSKNKMIEISDILIGATAIAHELPLATLNKKHFGRIENLILV